MLTPGNHNSYHNKKVMRNRHRPLCASNPPGKAQTTLFWLSCASRRPRDARPSTWLLPSRSFRPGSPQPFIFRISGVCVESSNFHTTKNVPENIPTPNLYFHTLSPPVSFTFFATSSNFTASSSIMAPFSAHKMFDTWDYSQNDAIMGPQNVRDPGLFRK